MTGGEIKLDKEDIKMQEYQHLIKSFSNELDIDDECTILAAQPDIKATKPSIIKGLREAAKKTAIHIGSDEPGIRNRGCASNVRT